MKGGRVEGKRERKERKGGEGRREKWRVERRRKKGER